MLADGALGHFPQPVRNALRVESMETHQKSLVLAVGDFAQTNDALAILARMLTPRKQIHLPSAEPFLLLLILG